MQRDDNNRDNSDKNNTSREKRSEDMDNWSSEHGKPSYDYLQAILDTDSVQSKEKLKSIAIDLGVEYDPGTPMAELVDRIMAVVKDSSYVTT